MPPFLSLYNSQFDWSSVGGMKHLAPIDLKSLYQAVRGNLAKLSIPIIIRHTK